MYKLKFIFLFCLVFHQSESKYVRRSAEVGNMNVVMETQEVWSWPNQPSSALKCYYWLDSGADVPVRITWKVGDGPRNSEILAICSQFTRKQGKCEKIQLFNNQRISISMIDMMVALQFNSIQQGDDRNYWCQVQVEDDMSEELGFDAASTVMRIYNNPAESLPKFHIVQADKKQHQVQQGGDITLTCTCEGYHCDDVVWYKGPNKQQFQLVYTKYQHSPPTPIQQQAYDDWMGRTKLINEYSLRMEDVRASDAGRYWCEVRSSEYYGIGEYATDASSTTLQIIN